MGKFAEILSDLCQGICRVLGQSRRRRRRCLSAHWIHPRCRTGSYHKISLANPSPAFSFCQRWPNFLLIQHSRAWFTLTRTLVVALHLYHHERCHYRRATSSLSLTRHITGSLFDPGHTEETLNLNWNYIVLYYQSLHWRFSFTLHWVPASLFPINTELWSGVLPPIHVWWQLWRSYHSL